MSERPIPIEDPQHILQIKDELILLWNQLPAMHQATMALVFFARVVDDTEYGQWLREAVAYCRPDESGDEEGASESAMT